METGKPPNQCGLKESVQKGARVASNLATKAALAFCFNQGLSFMVADDPWFKQAYGRPIGRKEISKEIIHIQNSLLSEIQVKLCGATIAIALDGWTNSRHSKMINYLIIHNGRAIFWRSIPSRFGKSAPVMFYLTKKAVLEMERVLKVVVMSLVADNENANKSLFSLLEDWRPWLLLIGCVHGFACKVFFGFLLRWRSISVLTMRMDFNLC